MLFLRFRCVVVALKMAHSCIVCNRSPLQGVLSEDEVCNLEKEFMAFVRREIHVEGRDFCDMSGDYSKPMESFSIINIMLPSK